MGIFDQAKDALGGNDAAGTGGQQDAERVEGLAGQATPARRPRTSVSPRRRGWTTR